MPLPTKVSRIFPKSNTTDTDMSVPQKMFTAEALQPPLIPPGRPKSSWWLTLFIGLYCKKPLFVPICLTLEQQLLVRKLSFYGNRSSHRPCLDLWPCRSRCSLCFGEWKQHLTSFTATEGSLSEVGPKAGLSGIAHVVEGWPALSSRPYRCSSDTGQHSSLDP